MTLKVRIERESIFNRVHYYGLLCWHANVCLWKFSFWIKNFYKISFFKLVEVNPLKPMEFCLLSPSVKFPWNSVVSDITGTVFGAHMLLCDCFLVLLCSLLCKIRSGTTDLSKPVNITVEVHESKVEGRYSIDGKAEMPGFTFVVIFAKIMHISALQPENNLWFYLLSVKSCICI